MSIEEIKQSPEGSETDRIWKALQYLEKRIETQRATLPKAAAQEAINGLARGLNI